MGFHREALLAPRPTPKLEDHPLSAVSDCLFNLFAKDNIKMDLQEVGGSCGNWMELAQDRENWRELVNTVMNFRVS
jgi:hypothetical protein